MREKNITRTFMITSVEVSLYNKDTKGIEKTTLKAVDIDTADIEKWVARQYKDFNVVVLEIEAISTTEAKYSMTVDDFISCARRV